jgi:Fe-S cluster assembly ATP-binding protein
VKVTRSLADTSITTAKIWPALAPEERAAKGVFLALQYPVEIPGVATLTFLKTALNAQRRARGEPEVDAMRTLKLVREKATALKIGEDMLRRPLNAGFSGGEKKRMEILQMSLFEPKLAIWTKPIPVSTSMR